MMFHRKVYDKLLEWKSKYASRYAVLLEGARRVGKTTIATNFARNEYDSFIYIDFSKAGDDIRQCFRHIDNLDEFFIMLSAVSKVSLVKNKSIIVFDEVQFFPQARQAIKHLVADGRYHYLETGSLVSIKTNVKDILVPSEEMKIDVPPMDYEEFTMACGNDSFACLKELFASEMAIPQNVNRSLMFDYRKYMLVGGMPQAVDAFVSGRDFFETDKVKRNIIDVYENDFRKLDNSGLLSMMYHSIPSQLAHNGSFKISRVIGKRSGKKHGSMLFNLIDSKTVLPAYDTSEPRLELSASQSPDRYKLYLADTGLFVTLMFHDVDVLKNDIYSKILLDKLPSDLGFLYENAVAQAIVASGRKLFFHSWSKDDKHRYEVDFIFNSDNKTVPLEVKSGSPRFHASLDDFCNKYGKCIGKSYIVSPRPNGDTGRHTAIPFYLLPFLLS